MKSHFKFNLLGKQGSPSKTHTHKKKHFPLTWSASVHPNSFGDFSRRESAISPVQKSSMGLLLWCSKHQKVTLKNSTAMSLSRNHDAVTQDNPQFH